MKLASESQIDSLSKDQFCVKDQRHVLRTVKSLAYIFPVRRLQSVFIVSILHRHCTFMVYYYLFGVFLS